MWPFKSEKKELIFDDKNIVQKTLSNYLNGMFVDNTFTTKDYVKNGFEANADLYAIITKLCTMASEVPIKIYKNNNGELEETKDEIVSAIISDPNPYLCYEEFVKQLYGYYLATGDSLLYAPTLQNGNNAGKLIGGIYVMPVQNVIIELGGWKEPIKSYRIDNDTQEVIDPINVVHIKQINLSVDNGQFACGMSPIKTAVNQITASNAAYKGIANTFKRFMPPGILTNESEPDGDVENYVKDQQKALEKAWRKKYANVNSNMAGVPVFVNGKWNYIKLGFDNFRDLQILEQAKNTREVLCNVFGVPIQLFNDTSATTYDNMKVAERLIYTNRLKPDLELIFSKLNKKIFKAYGVEVWPDFSEIPAMQANRNEIATSYDIGVKNGSYSLNEFRLKMGDTPIDDEIYDKHYVSLSMTPIEDVAYPTEQQVNNALNG